jgi:hypothetical protein
MTGKVLIFRTDDVVPAENYAIFSINYASIPYRFGAGKLGCPGRVYF